MNPTPPPITDDIALQTIKQVFESQTVNFQTHVHLQRCLLHFSSRLVRLNELEAAAQKQNVESK